MIPSHLAPQNVDVYNSYLDKLVEFASWLISHNYSIELFTSDIVVDKYALEDLYNRLCSFPAVSASSVVACQLRQ